MSAGGGATTRSDPSGGRTGEARVHQREDPKKDLKASSPCNNRPNNDPAVAHAQLGHTCADASRQFCDAQSSSGSFVRFMCCQSCQQLKDELQGAAVVTAGGATPASQDPERQAVAGRMTPVRRNGTTPVRNGTVSSGARPGAYRPTPRNRTAAPARQHTTPPARS